MAIKRFFANLDSTITNAMKSGLSPTNRGDDANMGKSDVLEVFSIWGQITGSVDESQELSRILLQFPVSSIITARTNKEIPASGSVRFNLNLYNAEHSSNVPENFNLVVLPIAQEWEEGTGLDMDDYKDTGAVNWTKRKNNVAWTTVGGHYHSEPVFSASFDTGLEDLSLDITKLVEEWIAGTKQNYGIGIKFIQEEEAYFSSSLGGAAPYTNSGSYIHNPHGMTGSMYTKKFFARGSQFYFKRPLLEARWDSSKSDDRLRVYNSSNLATTEDNTNNLYVYNKIKGSYKDIPNLSSVGGVDKLKVSLYAVLPTGSQTPVDTVTGSWVEQGIYSASFTLNTTSSVLYDVWYTGSGPGQSDSVQFFSGNFNVNSHSSVNFYDEKDFVISIGNLRSQYEKDTTAHFRISTRRKNWSPTIYTTSQNNSEVEIIDDLYYRVIRMLDKTPVIDFGTGSVNHTKVSYDISGSYFNLDLSCLKKEEQYGIQFLYKDGSSYVRVPQTYKFAISPEGK